MRKTDAVKDCISLLEILLTSVCYGNSGDFGEARIHCACKCRIKAELNSSLSLLCDKSPGRLCFLKSSYDISVVLQSIAAVLSKITTTNIATLIVGLTCIVLLLIGKEINLRFKKKLPVPIPMEIIVVNQL